MWSSAGKITSITHGERRGISFAVNANQPSLTVKRALFSDVRVLRDYGYNNPIPASIEATPRIQGRSVV
jgi:hypothetical protein